jgi:hypothetical protein
MKLQPPKRQVKKVRKPDLWGLMGIRWDSDETTMGDTVDIHSRPAYPYGKNKMPSPTKRGAHRVLRKETNRSLQ